MVPVQRVNTVSRPPLLIAAACLLPLAGCPGAGDGGGSPAGQLPAPRAARELVILDTLDWSAKYLEASGLTLRRGEGSLRLTVRDPERTAAVLANACLALRRRMTIISGNVSNAETTRLSAPGAGGTPQPYRRKVLTVTERGALEVVEDKSAFRKAYRPGHPDANKDGNVLLPNVYVSAEIEDWRSSRREYEVLRIAMNSLSARNVAPPARLLPEPVPPPAYEPKETAPAKATPVKPASGPGAAPIPVKTP
ncbi:MAG: flagellar basal body rod protein FlgC [Planctomycetota bacterium]|jgi:flagellar basal-body rod protein FlgC